MFEEEEMEERIYFVSISLLPRTFSRLPDIIFSNSLSNR